MSRRCNKSGLIAVPVGDWPLPDRLAWEAALYNGDILEDAGRAAHWSAKNRRAVVIYFGQWISWRHAHGIPTQDASRLWAKPEVLQAFVAYLRPRLAPASVATMIRNLNAALRVMYPGFDRTALKRRLARLQALAKPSRNKPARIRHSRQLLEAGIDWLEAAERALELYPRLTAARYRDGLIVALLALRPFRLANFTAVVMGRHLIAVGEGYRLCFSASETKNNRDIEVPYPNALVPYLGRYRDRYRLILLGDQTSDRLWISTRGTPMSEQAIYQQDCTVTQKMLGEPLNPHLFRDCAATTIAIDDPEHAVIIARILCHKTTKTAEQHHIHAGMIQANRLANAIVTEIRTGATSMKQETKPCEP